jgi:pimeloyl-ACP methyl ester carboxylesterase
LVASSGRHNPQIGRRRPISGAPGVRHLCTFLLEEFVFHLSKATAAIALCCTVAGAVLVGCDDGPGADEASWHSLVGEGLISGTAKIDVEGKSVNVSCSGSPAEDRPVIVLLAGAGDPLDKLAGFQKILSEEDRVCSYDRLGEGASDQPDGLQDFDSSGKILTAILDRVAGDAPVVLAGHSLGGLVAARYAPDHQDRVHGLVLLDATTPTAVADTTNLIPESATGPAAEVRGQLVAVNKGEYPEKLKVTDGEVRSAGDIPVEVIQHGRQDLAVIPEYGPDLERVWTEGQRKWLALSSNSTLSTATNSGHYIYIDQPDVAVQAVQRVASQIAD